MTKNVFTFRTSLCFAEPSVTGCVVMSNRRKFCFSVVNIDSCDICIPLAGVFWLRALCHAGSAFLLLVESWSWGCICNSELFNIHNHETAAATRHYAMIVPAITLIIVFCFFLSFISLGCKRRNYNSFCPIKFDKPREKSDDGIFPSLFQTLFPPGLVKDQNIFSFVSVLFILARCYSLGCGGSVLVN